jgi:hypothetical protein
MSRAAVLLIALTLAAADGPAVSLPDKVRTSPGRLVKLEASGGKIIRWASCSADCDLIVSESGRWAVFSCLVPGSYRVLAWTAAGDVPSEAAVCTVLVEGTTPGPRPPPQPEPPAPADELAKALAAAWAREQSPAREAHRDLLAGLYRGAVETAGREKIKTAGELYRVLAEAGTKLLPADALPHVRQALAGYLDRRLPTKPAEPLTAEVRARAAVEFARIADALEKLP